MVMLYHTITLLSTVFCKKITEQLFGHIIFLSKQLNAFF